MRDRNALNINSSVNGCMSAAELTHNPSKSNVGLGGSVERLIRADSPPAAGSEFTKLRPPRSTSLSSQFSPSSPLFVSARGGFRERKLLTRSVAIGGSSSRTTVDRTLSSRQCFGKRRHSIDFSDLVPSRPGFSTFCPTPRRARRVLSSTFPSPLPSLRSQ